MVPAIGFGNRHCLAAAFSGKARLPRIGHPDLNRAQPGRPQGGPGLADTFGNRSRHDTLLVVKCSITLKRDFAKAAPCPKDHCQAYGAGLGGEPRYSSIAGVSYDRSGVNLARGILFVLVVMHALRKDQSRSFNLTGDINGEVRVIERAFGLGQCPPTEAMTMLEDRLAA